MHSFRQFDKTVRQFPTHSTLCNCIKHLTSTIKHLHKTFQQLVKTSQHFQNCSTVFKTIKQRVFFIFFNIFQHLETFEAFIQQFYLQKKSLYIFSPQR